MNLKSTRLPLPKTNGGVDHSRTSLQHLDMLYQSLVLILNLHECRGSGDLIPILTTLHNYMVSYYGTNPMGAISLYKAMARYFAAMVRGTTGRMSDFEPEHWSVLNDCPYPMITLIDWYAMASTDKNLAKADLRRMLQVVYCLLNGNRVVLTGVSIDSKTITAPPSTNYTSGLPHKEKALAELGITPEAFQAVFKAKCAAASFKIITTAGPNGQATWTADKDAKAMIKDPALLDTYRMWCESAGLLSMVRSLSGCVAAPASLSGEHKVTDLKTGRIHAIEEWGGKTRLVAILDYWTQAALTPLHDTIAHFLEQIEMDGTFNQTKVIAKVKGWTADKNRTIYSYDLTAATDRIPMYLQTELLGYLLGEAGMANSWRDLLNTRDYIMPDGSAIKYAVGQPMGAKSSFPMLALVHHVIIKSCAISTGTTDYTDYVVVGDDNTQTSSAVAGAYTSFMAAIGVSINESKSFIHIADCLPAGEICKRLFIDGFELTAIPPKLLVKTCKYGHMAPTLQNEFHNRGYPILAPHLLTFFSAILDPKSLEGLLMLNSVPETVSGLHAHLDPNIPELKVGVWFKKLPLTLEQVKEAYMFALISEQLKRVDQLLKAAMVMADIIETKLLPDPKGAWPAPLYRLLPDKERLEALSKLPELHAGHPIVIASKNELARVLNYLSQLRSGSESVVAAARAGLMDVLRNSLSEIWLSNEERRNTINRSIFNAMLAALDKMETARIKLTDPKEMPVITYSVQLSSVQRMWSVSWRLDKPVALNAVKTRINLSVEDCKVKMTRVGSKIAVRNFRL